MNILSCLELGYTGGLNTVDDALLQVERHYDLFFLIDEAPDKLKSLILEGKKLGFNSLIVDILGAERIKELDAKLASDLDAMNSTNDIVDLGEDF